MLSRIPSHLSSDRLTRYEAERIKKRRAGQAIEELEAMGQDSERKAAKWVREWWNKEDHDQQELIALQLSVLELLQRRGKRKEYFRYLADIFQNKLKEEAIPKRYRITADLTDQGIVISLSKFGSNKVRSGAFAPSGIPKYDHYAAYVFAVRVGNTVAKWDGYRQTSAGGIMLTDKEDDTIYG